MGCLPCAETGHDDKLVIWGAYFSQMRVSSDYDLDEEVKECRAPAVACVASGESAGRAEHAQFWGKPRVRTAKMSTPGRQERNVTLPNQTRH
jgi:hypothetical protein